jgi:predicted GNAT family N-acyltransferase
MQMSHSGPVHIIMTDYESAAQQIRAIRDEVFIVEQQIAREDEFDGRDALCVHALALAGDRPLGTGRLDLERDGKIGRLAVLKQFRRLGIGSPTHAGF